MCTVPTDSYISTTCVGLLPYPPPPFPQELRRGVDRAVIYSLCFNASSQYVACSSDKGTVHVFSIGEVRMAASLLCMCVCVIVMFTMQC